MENTAVEMFRSTVQYENELIWVKPVCDFFNLHVQNQYTRIKKDPILGNLYGKNHTDLSKNGNLYGKNRPDLGLIDGNGRILLSRKGFVRWIQIISANSINKDMRDKFITYQELIFDYLYGSAEEEKETKFHYQRLRKLERLYGKIGSEIKREKFKVASYLNHRYQIPINFDNHEIAQKSEKNLN